MKTLIFTLFFRRGVGRDGRLGEGRGGDPLHVHRGAAGPRLGGAGVRRLHPPAHRHPAAGRRDVGGAQGHGPRDLCRGRAAPTHQHPALLNQQHCRCVCVTLCIFCQFLSFLTMSNALHGKMNIYFPRMGGSCYDVAEFNLCSTKNIFRC